MVHDLGHKYPHRPRRSAPSMAGNFGRFAKRFEVVHLGVNLQSPLPPAGDRPLKRE